MLLIILAIIRPGNAKKLSWKLMAGVTILSGLNLVWNHTSVALIANILSLIIASGLSFYTKGSFIISALQALRSIICSPFSNLIIYFSSSEPIFTKSRAGYKFLVFAIPIGITFIFFLLYSEGNQAFSLVINRINLNFISWGWIFFTFGGFLLLFGIFYPVISSKLAKFEDSQTDDIFRRANKNKDFKNMGLRTEFQTGKVLLILLNLLLAIVNLIDINYLFINKNAIAGHSEAVHQGVNTLIFSIILAVAIILFLFRGNLNFFRNNFILKILAYAWICQNAVMVFNISIKDGLYVLEFGLTEKRIGVFIYIVLTAIGLLTTFHKIYSVKSNWYLVKINSILFFTILFITSFFNWGNIITNYNLQHVAKEKIDYDYLISLSDSNIPQLQTLLNSTNINHDQKLKILSKSDLFYYSYLSKEWQSWNYDDYTTNKILNQIRK